MVLGSFTHASVEDVALGVLVVRSDQETSVEGFMDCWVLPSGCSHASEQVVVGRTFVLYHEPVCQRMRQDSAETEFHAALNNRNVTVHPS